MRSENVRNFIAEEKGDWFEIEEPESGSNRWFHLKFKLYSAGKSNTICYFTSVNEMDIMTKFRSKQEEQNLLSKGILGLLKLKSLL